MDLHDSPTIRWLIFKQLEGAAHRPRSLPPLDFSAKFNMAVRPTRAERERRQAKSVSVTMREMETWVGSVMRGEGGQKARFGTVMILKVASLPFDMTRVRLPPSFWLVTVKGDENGWDWFGVAATEAKY
jgi:hypothetical protein